MKLHRYAIAEFAEQVPAIAKWRTTTSSGAVVEVLDVINAQEVDQESADWLSPRLIVNHNYARRSAVVLCATVPTTFEIHGRTTLKFADSSRRLAEDALRFMRGCLSIQGQVGCDLWSPTPFLALEGENDRERGTLERVVKIDLPPWWDHYPFALPGLTSPVDFGNPVFRDREEGVLLLGAAISAGYGVAKVHELFRLLEHAFALPPRQLIGPLVEFLSSHEWDLGYTRVEVTEWVDHVRDPSTHADLQRQGNFALDHDVQRYMVRIEQAAIDVFLNKEDWHTASSTRTVRCPLRSAVSANGNTTVTDGSRLGAISGWDHYQAFRLKGKLDEPPHKPPFGYRLARWFFTEEEHVALERDIN